MDSLRSRRASPAPRPTRNAAAGKPAALGTALGAGIVGAFVIVAYVWIVSLGTWTDWPEAYDYAHYDRLASAFMEGHLFLDERPDPALLALADPYDPASRQDIPYLTDASLYQGRYYLYFGPVPAIVLLIPKLVVPATIHDIYLVFSFACFLFLAQAALLVRIRRRLFPSLPSWLLAASILFLGLSAPYTWLLGSQAAPHNAAIAAGQAFFLAGLFMAFGALEGPSVHRGKAAAAGILWAAAAGSRITQALPIAAVVLVILWHLGRRSVAPQERGRFVGDLLAFVIPLAAGAGALGWYNWARFGSPLETGISYQLAMLPIQQYAEQLFSWKYVIQNFYNYVLNPPRLRYAFPYIWPQIGLRSSIIAGLRLSPIYFTEEITGLMYVAPIVVWLVTFAFPTRDVGESAQGGGNGARNALWVQPALAASFVAGFSVFLAFFWASDRYMIDFVPPILVLSTTAFWQATESLRRRPAARALVIALGVLLMLLALVLSSALTVGQNAGAYAALDPHISRQLRRLFAP